MHKCGLLTVGLGLALTIGGLTPSAVRADQGGVPPAPSCGIGQAEAQFLIGLPVRPGASEASLLSPILLGCARPNQTSSSARSS